MPVRHGRNASSREQSRGVARARASGRDSEKSPRSSSAAATRIVSRIRRALSSATGIEELTLWSSWSISICEGLFGGPVHVAEAGGDVRFVRTCKRSRSTFVTAPQICRWSYRKYAGGGDSVGFCGLCDSAEVRNAPSLNEKTSYLVWVFSTKFRT